jgi:hypothetical protein
VSWLSACKEVSKEAEERPLLEEVTKRTNEDRYREPLTVDYFILHLLSHTFPCFLFLKCRNVLLHLSSARVCAGNKRPCKQFLLNFGG